MVTKVTSKPLRALALAQNGRRGEAEEMLSDRDVSGEALLARGYLCMASDPGSAKDLLAQSRRLLPTDLSHLAAVYEARAYEYLGQVAEGRVLINEVLKQPLSGEVKAQALLVRAVFYMYAPMRALKSLEQIDLSGLGPGLKGRIHNQRARVFSELQRFDQALLEYAGAASFFEEAGDFAGVAHAYNNQAAVERKLLKFADAHESVDRALALATADDPFIPAFMDHKAQIFLQQNQTVEAETWARKAVALTNAAQQTASYIECTCTLAYAVALQERYPEASLLFSEIYTLARSLDSNELLFRITAIRKQLAEDFAKRSELELMERALAITNGSYRGAAKLLNMTHPALIKALKQSRLSWKPKKPRSVIRKPCNTSRLS